MSKKGQIRSAQSFDQLLDAKYGKAGVNARDKFEEKAQYFVISELLEAARKEPGWVKKYS